VYGTNSSSRSRLAANWCISRLHLILQRLREAFGEVFVVCVPGNHGRLTKKPMAKGGTEACFDTLIYDQLADRLRDDARIRFHIPPAGDCIVQVAGTRYLVMHGHQMGVKGGEIAMKLMFDLGIKGANIKLEIDAGDIFAFTQQRIESGVLGGRPVGRI
jgi:hypothetical protein